MTIEGEPGSSVSQDGKETSQNQKLQGTSSGGNASRESRTSENVKDPTVSKTPDKTSEIPQFLVEISGSRSSGILDGSSDCPTPVSAISGASGDDWVPSPAASLELGLASPSSLMDDSSSSETSKNLVITQETSNSALEGVLSVMSDSSDTVEKNGGELQWSVANQKADLNIQNPTSPEALRNSQTMGERARSPTACQLEFSASMPNLRNNGANESETDDSEIRAALVDKRVRVVQLLAVGCVSVFCGLLASVWAQVSCEFFVAEVVGYAGDDDTSGVFFEEKLRYGLWRYSPGEASCTSYGYDDEADATIIPRLAGVIATMGGVLAIGVLFAYLVFGYAKKKIWEIAVVLAVMAGVSQLCTLLFLVVGVCEKYECIPGPGSMGTVLSGFSFFILGFEMLYNMPRDSYAFESGHYPPHERPTTILRGFQTSDIREWFLSYFERIGGETRERPFPSLNAFHRRRHHEDNPLGEDMLSQDMYDPPSHQIV